MTNHDQSTYRKHFALGFFVLGLCALVAGVVAAVVLGSSEWLAWGMVGGGVIFFIGDQMRAIRAMDVLAVLGEQARTSAR